MIEKDGYRLSVSEQGGSVIVALGAAHSGHGIVLTVDEARDFVNALERHIGVARTHQHEAATAL